MYFIYFIIIVIIMSAQGMRVSATIRKQWMQNVAAVVLHGHGGTADHQSLRPARRPSGRPHGGKGQIQLRRLVADRSEAGRKHVRGWSQTC